MLYQDIKAIFSLVRDLNLLVLVEDLRRGLVAARSWALEGPDGKYKLCPLAHPWVGLTEDDNEGAQESMTQVYRAGGMAVFDTMGEFIGWWDGDDYGNPCHEFNSRRTNDLLLVLEEIYRERLADADAVQAVLQPTQQEELTHAV